MSGVQGVGVRWSPTALLLFAMGGASLVLVFWTQNPVPLFLAVPLLLAPIAAGIAVPPGPLRGKLAWTLAGSGAEVEVRGRLTLPAAIDPSELRVELPAVAPLVELSPLRVTGSGLALELEVSYRAPHPCLARLSVPRVAWQDRLGLVELPVEVEGLPLLLERFPPEVSRVGAARLRRTIPAPGEVRSRATGAAGEFFAVREAIATDTPRQINWRASARVGRRVANDFYLERTGDLLILLDLRPTSLGPERDRTLLAIARAAALGIADGFLTEKARVGLAAFEEFLEPLRLGTGRRQRYRIHRMLESLDVGTTVGPAERAAVSLRRYFPPGVTTLLISSFADAEGLDLLPHLRRRGYPTFVLSPSPLPLLRGTGGLSPEDDAIANRLLLLVRRQRLNAAWGEAPVLDWEDYWSLAPLVRFLSAPIRRGSPV